MIRHSPGPVRARWGEVTWCAGVGTRHPVPSPLPPRACAQRVGSVGCPSPSPATSRRGGRSRVLKWTDGFFPELQRLFLHLQRCPLGFPERGGAPSPCSCPLPLRASSREDEGEAPLLASASPLFCPYGALETGFDLSECGGSHGDQGQQRSLFSNGTPLNQGAALCRSLRALFQRQKVDG